jgi:hypothetical protein
MTEDKTVDMAHISFLDVIKLLITTSGPANAKGMLVRNAISTAEHISPVDYASFDAYLAAVADGSNPVARIEGKAEHAGNFVFGLKHCPFGPSIKNYVRIFKKLPDEFGGFTAEFNKPGPVTEQYRIGGGAGVSPFCAVHQPMRSAVASKITIMGKKIQITQLGCKSESGKKGFAVKRIAECEVSQEKVSAILDNHMCCYVIQLPE